MNLKDLLIKDLMSKKENKVKKSKEVFHLESLRIQKK